MTSFDSREVSLRLDGPDSTDVSLPFDMAEQIEVSYGAMTSPRARGLGARRGAVAGSLTAVIPTLAIRALTSSWSEGEASKEDPIVIRTIFPARYIDLARNAVVGGAVGAGLGYLLGGRSKERWVTVANPSVAAVVTDRSLGLSIRVR